MTPSARWHIQHAVREALTLVDATDAKWLKHDIMASRTFDRSPDPDDQAVTPWSYESDGYALVDERDTDERWIGCDDAPYLRDWR